MLLWEGGGAGWAAMAPWSQVHILCLTYA
jgi:hypothetical protein